MACRGLRCVVPFLSVVGLFWIKNSQQKVAGCIELVAAEFLMRGGFYNFVDVACFRGELLGRKSIDDFPLSFIVWTQSRGLGWRSSSSWSWKQVVRKSCRTKQSRVVGQTPASVKCGNLWVRSLKSKSLQVLFGFSFVVGTLFFHSAAGLSELQFIWLLIIEQS